MRYYIYAYLDPRKPGSFNYGELNFTHEPFYIGKGSTNRSDIGLKYGSRKKERIKEIEKENKFPIVIILVEEIKDEREAYDKEEKIIKLIGREITKNGPLVNVFSGYYFRGIRHDEEWKKLLSKPVLQYDLNDNLIGEYSSIKEAAKITGIHKVAIGTSARSKNRRAGRFIWKYKNPEDRLQGHLKEEFKTKPGKSINRSGPKSKNHKENIKIALTGILKSEEHKSNMSKSKREKSKKIIQLDKKGNTIKEWNSIMDIFDQLKFNRYGIHQCCVGKAKQSYGFIWKYAE
jgi:hypothetical protein